MEELAQIAYERLNAKNKLYFSPTSWFSKHLGLILSQCRVPMKTAVSIPKAGIHKEYLLQLQTFMPAK